MWGPASTFSRGRAYNTETMGYHARSKGRQMTQDDTSTLAGAGEGPLGPGDPAAPQGREGTPEPRRPLWRDLVQFALAFAVMIGAIWLLRLFVIEPFTVPTGSMIPTIEKGDSMYAEKVSLWFDDTPQVGQVYTFTCPVPADDGTYEVMIKRVIATAGQVVDLRDGHVYVDGVMLDEPYVHGKQSVAERTAPGVDVTYPYTVPDGCFWAMGDNRTNSSDSRYFGPVPYDNLIAHAVFRYWPVVRAMGDVEVDMGGFSFTAHPLELNLGALDYTS